MITRTLLIQNKLGLHARAASVLVKAAQTFASEIALANHAKTANGKSIMSVLMLEATLGTELRLEVNGEDEAAAAAALEALINDRFGEEE